MARTPITGFRLAPELLERLDRYAERLAGETGLAVSRAAAVTKLLTSALDAEDQRTGRVKRSTSRASKR